MNTNIDLNLTLEEVNISMPSLAKQPYEVVFSLMERIRNQVQPQLPNNEPTTDTLPN